MKKKILINAVDPEECRIARVAENLLEDFYTESASHQITQGNMYKGIIARVEPSLQAAFVDYGAERHGFLQISDIHSDYYNDYPSGKPTIRQLVKRGQELLVQVVKDPQGTKGALLTTFLSLAGRLVVLMPGSGNLGVSRKIEAEAERSRLKQIIHGLKPPEEFGLIVRTAGEGASKTALTKDYRYLMRLWKTLKGNVMHMAAPVLMHKESSLVERSLRDNFTPEVTEILIDNEAVYNEARQFMGIISPKYKKIVKLYKGDKPIFTKYELERKITSIFENRVEMKSGGSIVIEQTEALVSIDVNSGKATREKSIESTAFQTNLEAAEEIARQLRLRDMGGLIVIDFIDMRDTKHRREVEQTLKRFLKFDRAKTRVGRISMFGLMEMIRQRIRPSIRFGSYVLCLHCKGKGQIPTPDTLGVAFLRELSLKSIRVKTRTVTGYVPPAVADFLLNKKRKELLGLEQRRQISIIIKTDPGLVPGEHKITVN